MSEVHKKKRGCKTLISYNQVFNEMERQLQAARRTADKSEIREALSAIRSLCEVALGEGLMKEEKTFPKLLTSTEVQALSPLEGKPLQEKDANGGSIFDF